MRMVMLAAVLVAGCTATDTVRVQNVQILDPVPNAPQTDYQRYKVAREAALTGKASAPRTIPVALPVKAPTAAQIAPDPAPVIVAPRVAAKPAATVVVTDPVAVAKSGPWPRQPISAAAHEAACGRYYTAAKAQENFLRAGGPQVDPVGLDPDGDGYACGYRPDSGL